jgi:1-acyl-sn-glycerol-3-phosphate acyltransferase
MNEAHLLGNGTLRNIMLWLLRLLMRLLLRFEITHVENVPPTGPLVIIINHIAFLDPVMVLGSFPRLVIPMAKQETFKLFILGWLSKTYGTIFVRRGELDLNAIKTALQVLKNDGVVLVAPEGTRSPSHQMQEAKEGAAMLALRSGATIVPIGVTGTHRVKDSWLKLQRAPVRLTVGTPFCLRSPDNHRRANRAELAVMTQEMMYRLAALLPEEFRGVYHNLEAATEKYLIAHQAKTGQKIFTRPTVSPDQATDYN